MLLRIAIPVFILAIGFALARWLGHPVDPPSPQPAPPQVLKTEITELRRSDYQIVLESQGTVRAHHETTLTPQVSGTIVRIHPAFEDGAFFRKNDILAELDDADYTAEVVSARSSLARAEATLAQEEARARQAKLNWDDLGYDDAPSDLVLRIPQLKEARANVEAATAALEQARRHLDRTRIRAPFDGRVRSRAVGLGQAVGASTPLGEIYATDFAEIRLPLTPRDLRFIRLPSLPDDPEIPVILTNALGDDIATRWKARILRTEGTLDETSRELFAIARIDDPFGLTTKAPPLRIGQPVRAAIPGNILENVFVLPRHAMRDIDRIYLVDPSSKSLVRTPIAPVWSTASEVVVRDGLEEGQWLSTTRLTYSPNGAPVEILQPAVEAQAGHPESSKAGS